MNYLLNSDKCSSFAWPVAIVCISSQIMLRKRKGSFDSEVGREEKRRKRLEEAKHYIECTGSSIKDAAAHFDVGRNSLGTFLKKGFQQVGRPSFLKKDEIKNLRLYLVALDTAHLQQSLVSTSAVIQKLSNSQTKPTPPTVHKYVHDAGLYIRKACSADKGRLRIIESIEDFLHYYDIVEDMLDWIAHDPRQIFNVDEVGIQLAERSIHLVTGCQYLNKELNQTSLHVTLVLCTCPGQNGVFMEPHFIFQDDAEAPRNLLCGTVNSTCQSNSTGYQDECTWAHWMSLFIIWKRHWLQQNGYGPSDPVLLLLDGHYSHLSHEVLFTATKNSIAIVCMLSHATHLVQPNDKSVNKRFKQNLDEELLKMASNDLTVQNFDIAHLCKKVLMQQNMKGAITSSYCQVSSYWISCFAHKDIFRLGSILLIKWLSSVSLESTRST